MNIIFKYRMLSDESDNFVRDFEVYPDMTLAEFNAFLLDALGYEPTMVSIFKSDAEWRPVEEFSEIDNQCKSMNFSTNCQIFYL